MSSDRTEFSEHSDPPEEDLVYQGEAVVGEGMREAGGESQPASDSARIPSGGIPSGGIPLGGQSPGRPQRVDSRPRLRFGIGAIMVAITVLAFQYSLVSYLGPWAALIFPPVLCGALVLIVLGVELRSWQRTDASQTQRMGRTTFGWLIVYIFLLGVSAMAAGGGKISYDLFMAWRIERSVQQDFGFTYAPNYIWGENMRTRSTVFFVMIKPGGAFERAGVRGGEAVVTELSPSEWLRMLDENRGQSVEIRLAQGAPATALEKCTQRVVTVDLPR
jgi:hypothetical protein